MSKTVEIYSTPTCHFCQAAKAYFAENNIEYTNYDVATDMEKRKEMIEISSQMGVPVIVVNDGQTKEVLVGFDESKIRGLLGL